MLVYIINQIYMKIIHIITLNKSYLWRYKIKYDIKLNKILKFIKWWVMDLKYNMYMSSNGIWTMDHIRVGSYY